MNKLLPGSRLVFFLFIFPFYKKISIFFVFRMYHLFKNCHHCFKLSSHWFCLLIKNPLRKKTSSWLMFSDKRLSICKQIPYSRWLLSILLFPAGGLDPIGLTLKEGHQKIRASHLQKAFTSIIFSHNSFQSKLYLMSFFMFSKA